MKTVNLKKIYSKSYLILILIGYLPLICKVLSINYLFDIGDGIRILSQIAFISIIFKCYEETLFNPLYKILGKNNIDNKDNRNVISRSLLILLTFLSVIFTSLILLLLKPIMRISYVPSDIFNPTYKFLFIYTIALLFKILSKYLFTNSLINNNSKEMFIYLLINSILTIVLYTLFVPSFSLNLGCIGIGVSELIVSIVSIIYLIIRLVKENRKTNRVMINYKEYFKLSFICLVETLIRNAIYYFVILVLINKLDNQDLYFISNEYIWSFMLVAILAQSNLIKQDISNNNKMDLKPYFINSIILDIVMILLIPFSILVFKYFYRLDNYMDYFLVLIKLFPCYLIFSIDSVIEAYFLTIGKVKYILIEGIITNILVYLTSYILYLTNIWTISLDSIILLFNLGVIISSLYMIVVYLYNHYKDNKEAIKVSEL